jgi:hypothetical protein
MRSSKYLVGLSLTLAMLFAFVLVQPSTGQMRGIPKLYGEFKVPEVGAYATYKVINNANKAERITKLSIVGKEKGEEEEELYWYEVQETDSKTGTVTIIKLLIAGNPQEIETIHRMITKKDKDKALEMPPELMKLVSEIAPDTTEAEEPKIKNLGTEKVRMMDTTMQCTHLKYTYKDKSTAEAWTNDQIPLFGVVRSTSPDLNMELIEYGTDAKTAITEEPELLDMSGMK